MIIITGAPRTGTSLMMQIFREAGFPVYGWKNSFHDSLEKFNPDGFYENNNITRTGLNFQTSKLPPQKLTAIKIFGDGLPNTDSAYITSLVICIRDCLESISSWNSLTEVDREIINVKQAREPEENYLSHYYNIIVAAVRRNLLFTVVDYENVISNPGEVGQRLFNFIGCGRFDFITQCVKEKKGGAEYVPKNKDLVEYNNILKSQILSGEIFQKKNLEALEIVVGEVNSNIQKRIKNES